MNSPKFFRLLICHLLFITTFLNSFSQAGGPPMLTDDPDVVDFHKWEINISTNPEISDHFELALPYLDINYGVWHNLQLKLETPLIFSDFQKHITSTIGDVIVGVKYRFYENESLLFTAGTYPQWALRGEQGFFVPLLLQKALVNF